MAKNVGVVIVLIFLSQVFTGLNIGLMSLDTAQLKVLIEVRHTDEASFKAAMYARKILPLRQKGNLLLCTILLGNTAVNAVMAIFLGNVAGGFVGWLVTTILIVVLCEIVPQSVCTRHGLFLGAMGAPIIQIAMVVFYVITKPYAIVLDCLFPQRENMLDRSQLRALVEYQKTAQPNMLAKGQAEMLIGALGFAERSVAEVMVPLEKAFTIKLNTVLDYDLVASVVKSGFSRFPVVCPETGQVKGILHCKDLLKQRFLHNPIETVFAGTESTTTTTLSPQTAGDLLQALLDMHHERDVYHCGKNTKLMALLSEFKKHAHLAVVADVEELGEASATAPHIGIVTLHNIFETLLHAEHGGFEEEAQALSRKQVLKQAGTVRIFDPQLCGTADQPIGENEAEAIAAFLASNSKEFSSNLVSNEELVRLLKELRPLHLARREPLYCRNREASCGTLVLHGAIGVVSGEESFESTMGPLSCLGMRALELPPPSLEAEPHEQGALGVVRREKELQALRRFRYTPDFSASALTEKCLVIQIDRARYLEAHLQSKYASKCA